MLYLFIIVMIMLFLFKLKPDLFNKNVQKGQNTKVQIDESIDPNAKLPYLKKDYLLTKAERSFYEVMGLAVQDMGLSIFTKVRLADLLYIPSNTEGKLVYWNKIQSKHVDFILCDSKEMKPLLIIELDDSSHEREDRAKRDEFVDKALRDAGLSILRVPAKASYNVQELSNSIKEVIAI